MPRRQGEKHSPKEDLARSVRLQTEYLFSDASFFKDRRMHALTEGEGAQGWCSIPSLLQAQPRLRNLVESLARSENELTPNTNAADEGSILNRCFLGAVERSEVLMTNKSKLLVKRSLLRPAPPPLHDPSSSLGSPGSHLSSRSENMVKRKIKAVGWTCLRRLAASEARREKLLADPSKPQQRAGAASGVKPVEKPDGTVVLWRREWVTEYPERTTRFPALFWRLPTLEEKKRYRWAEYGESQ